MEEEILLDIENLEVTYYHVIVAVQGVSLRVPVNKTVGLLGINGAGKTTTLRAISGFLGIDNAEVTDGKIEFCGERIDGKKPHWVSSRGIHLVPERAKTFDTLTVKEHLELNPRVKGEEQKRLVDIIYQHFPSLYERRNEIAGYLSGGERQMLAISQGILRKPKILMLDEMSLGLSPKVVSHLVQDLLSLKKELNLAMLVVEQNMAMALEFVDYGYIIEGGRVVMGGTPQNLTQHEDVREFYLGMGKAGMKSYRDVKQYRRVRRWWG